MTEPQSREDIYNLIVAGAISYEEFYSWCEERESEIREDALEYGNSCSGYYGQPQ